jgi:phosphoserine phosphatase
VGLWKGSALEDIHGFLDRIEANRHVPSVTRVLKSYGIPSIIISSGFHHVARRIQVANQWAPLVVYANELIDGPGVRIQVSADSSSPISKRALGTVALEKIGVDPKQTLVVSDAERDLQALSACGFHLHIRQEDDLLRALHFLE